MDNPELTTMETAVERIMASSVIAIVLPNACGLDVGGSAYALAAGLKSLGKMVSVFAPAPLPTNAIAPFGQHFAGEEPLREFIISFDLARSPIKELRYEKAENRLDIILSPTSGRIKREDVEFRYGPLRYDLAITLGVASLGHASEAMAPIPELFHEKPILNIDANPANQRFGELNFISEENAGRYPTIPTLTYELLERLGALPNDAASASALMAALEMATKHFKPQRTGITELGMALALVERGADPSAVEQALRLEEQRRAANPQLLGRALARSRVDEKTRTAWLTLSADDFARTGTQPDEAEHIAEHMAECFPACERAVLMWQEPTTQRVQALIQLTDPAEARAMTAETHVDAKSAGVMAIASQPTFLEAERVITALLRTLDAVE